MKANLVIIKIKRRTIAFLILASVFIIIPFIKCQKINDAFFGEKEPSVNDIVSNGKKKLGEGNFQEAAKIFAEGVKIYPNNPEIRFGLALAQSAILLKNVENVTIELGNIIIQNIIIQLVSGTSPRHIRQQ
jgi:outer membrane protein assembly factor BamD (BamD/ComL family)